MINDIDINEIVVSNKFSFGKQHFRYFSGYKDNKENRPLCKFFPNMSIYKIYSGKTKCMYFMIKDEQVFHKYMTVWEKASDIIIIKTNSDLIYNKKYIKAEKFSTQKKAFSIFIYL